jgi:hypothetical protein
MFLVDRFLILPPVVLSDYSSSETRIRTTRKNGNKRYSQNCELLGSDLGCGISKSVEYIGRIPTPYIGIRNLTSVKIATYGLDFTTLDDGEILIQYCFAHI